MVNPALLAAVPEMIKTAEKISARTSDPIYTHVFEDGSRLNVTPRGLVAVGGAALMGTTAYVIYQLWELFTTSDMSSSKKKTAANTLGNVLNAISPGAGTGLIVASGYL